MCTDLFVAGGYAKHPPADSHSTSRGNKGKGKDEYPDYKGKGKGDYPASSKYPSSRHGDKSRRPFAGNSKNDEDDEMPPDPYFFKESGDGTDNGSRSEDPRGPGNCLLAHPLKISARRG